LRTALIVLVFTPPHPQPKPAVIHLRRLILRLALFSLAATAHGEELDPSTVTRKVILTGNKQVRVAADSLGQSAFSFESPDAWLFIDGIAPSKVVSGFLNRMWVANEPAFLDANIRVHAYETGTLVIPHGPAHAAMTVFGGASFSGASMPLRC